MKIVFQLGAHAPAPAGTNGRQQPGVGVSSQLTSVIPKSPLGGENGSALSSSQPPKWEGLSTFLNDTDSYGVTKTLNHVRAGFRSFFRSYRAEIKKKKEKEEKEKEKGKEKEREKDSNCCDPKPPEYLQDYETGAMVNDVLMCGEMVQAVYDTLFTRDIYSSFFGNVAPNTIRQGRPLSDDAIKERTLLGEQAQQYTVRRIIRADSGAYKLVANDARNYIGFIAESPAGEGGVDVVIVFRGTITNGEWFQDAKAIKVPWSGGRMDPVPPATVLEASPFRADSRAFLLPALATLALENDVLRMLVYDCALILVKVINLAFNFLPGGYLVSTALDWVLHEGPELLAAAVRVVHALLEAPGPLHECAALLGGAFHVAAELLARALGVITAALDAPGPLHECATLLAAAFGVSTAALVSVDPLVVAVLVGTAAWLAYGTLSVMVEDPKEWRKNAKTLAGLVGPWLHYGATSIWKGLFDKPKSDPRVSYGFKEMYCDAQAAKHVSCGNNSSNNGAAEIEPKDESPRLTVLRALTEIMQKKQVKSITITGHSLGGALASMCGFDLATTITEALSRHSIVSEGAAAQPKCRKGLQDTLYNKTVEAREEFKACINPADSSSSSSSSSSSNGISSSSSNGTGSLASGSNGTSNNGSSSGSNGRRAQNPAIGVVTFAAPRVGDLTYSSALGPRTLMCAWSSMEPLWDSNYAPSIGDKLSILLRDTLKRLVGMVWYLTGAAQISWANNAHGGDKAGQQARVAMLRVQNAHDVVPNLPITAPLLGFWYVHGGYDLTLNSYFVPYFKNSCLGASLGNLHNLEMHLHLLNPMRDMALVNKTADLLIPEKQVPGNWWSPLPHKGMERGTNGKWRREGDVVDELKETRGSGLRAWRSRQV